MLSLIAQDTACRCFRSCPWLSKKYWEIFWQKDETTPLVRTHSK